MRSLVDETCLLHKIRSMKIVPDNSLKKKSFKRVLNGAISGSNLGSRSAVTLRVRGECALCRLNTMSVTSG